MRAAGIGIWLVWPTFTGVIVGAVLWATHDALASGSWEALIHDELTAIEHGADYEKHARAYLDWEVALVEQIKRDPAIRFRAYD